MGQPERRCVIEKAAVRRFLRRISSQSEGVVVPLTARQALAILDRHSVTWMAYRMGALRLCEESNSSTRLTSSSPDILEVAKGAIDGACQWT